MDARQGLTKTEVAAQLRALGVREGGVLLVHTSFRAVRPVEGGPEGLIDALLDVLGPRGTLVMPTMSDGESVFDPRTTPSVDMGIVAERFRQLRGVMRSTHPGGSFAATGPHAPAVCAPQPLEPPHGPESPPGRVHALGGQVLLLGVDHSESTTIHVAEAIARVPYSVAHPCVVGRRADGSLEVVGVRETDHCCTGFRKMNAWLRAEGAQREGAVGHAHAVLADAKDVVRVAVRALEADPFVFLCAPEAGCEECTTARASI